jgi:hypothetical protein
MKHLHAYQPVDLRLSRLALSELMHDNCQLRLEYLKRKIYFILAWRLMYDLLETVERDKNIIQNSLV